MISRIVVGCVVVSMTLAACAGDKEDNEEGTEQGEPSAEPEAEPEDEPAAEPEGEPAEEPAAEPEPEGNGEPPEPPTMEAAEPLTGDLHVTWTLPDGGCDMIELLRNADGGDFEVEFVLTGVAESQHDSSADAPTMYCYRARCIKDGVTSADSNEVCGTP